MKITLRGCNGKKREIPLEELIEKFWDDKQSNQHASKCQPALVTRKFMRK